MQYKIYIAATNQHVGKTTCTLGICAALQEKGYKVGYCKPVGQEFVSLENQLVADKDALLFSKTLGFDLQPSIHSPVILGDGATQAFWDNPSAFNYRQKIKTAMQGFPSDKYNWVVCEGTGHPGVGSIVGLSNAVVARMIGARVVLIVKGGIGRTVDEMALSLALFKREGVAVEGVIVNKVLPEKVEKIRHYVGKILNAWGIPLLGVIPYDETLMFPLFEQIRGAVKGKILFNSEFMENRIADFISGSLVESYDLSSHKNILLVSNSLRLPEVLRKVIKIAEKQGLSHPDIAGILVTGTDDGHPSILEDSFCMDFIQKYQVPVVETALDTYGAALRISAIEVKINTRTPWKATRAMELVKQHVDLDSLVAIMATRPGRK